MSKIFVYCVQLFLFKYHHGMVPSIFQNFYTYNHDLHEYMTRQSDCLHSFGARTAQRYRALRFIGIKIFNHFVGKISMDCLFMTYKYNLKKYLISNDVSCLAPNQHSNVNIINFILCVMILTYVDSYPRTNYNYTVIILLPYKFIGYCITQSLRA